MHGFVSHERSIAAQWHADYLLFVDWMDNKAEGILTGKLFEYLASGRPIICIGFHDDSEAAGLIRNARAGVVLTSVSSIQEYLERLPSRAPATRMFHDLVKAYSRQEQAMAFLESIRAVIRA
jgi:hypothetical protein